MHHKSCSVFECCRLKRLTLDRLSKGEWTGPVVERRGDLVVEWWAGPAVEASVDHGPTTGGTGASTAVEHRVCCG